MPSETILIVDDMQTDRELMGGIVSRAGHQPLYASNGEEAVALAAAHRPKLILLDIVMPKQDGFAVCRELKKRAETARIPVVLVTSKGSDSDKFWGKRQGADDHIVKPYNPATVNDIIRRFVG